MNERPGDRRKAEELIHEVWVDDVGVREPATFRNTNTDQSIDEYLGESRRR